jgi:hypothetical protein
MHIVLSTDFIIQEEEKKREWMTINSTRQAHIENPTCLQVRHQPDQEDGLS